MRVDLTGLWASLTGCAMIELLGNLRGDFVAAEMVGLMTNLDDLIGSLIASLTEVAILKLLNYFIDRSVDLITDLWVRNVKA